MPESTFSPWPEGCETAISLTFDDGMKSQLERAIPYMNKVGLRGTFYVVPNDNYRELLQPWIEVAKAGHEVGNHTTRHPCSKSLGRSFGLEQLTLADIEADILLAEARLEELMPGQPRSFCYPCYYHHVGAGLTRQSYVPVVAKHFIAGRTGTCNRGYLVDTAACDLHCLESQACETMTGYEMIGLCERAANRRHWCILTFHGIHEGQLSVSDGDLRELCDHLVKHQKRFYVTPVVEVAKRIATARANQ